MTYECPVCGIADPYAYLRCFHGGCPDGRDPRPNPFDKVWKVNCLHIPTGQTTQFEHRESSREGFLAELARWNGQQPGVWQYWEAPR